MNEGRTVSVLPAGNLHLAVIVAEIGSITWHLAWLAARHLASQDRMRANSRLRADAYCHARN